MSLETEIIISFIYKRSGKDQLSFSELYLTLSMELNWFTPDSAKLFVNNAINNKILIKKNNLLTPNFDIEKVEIPIGFYPSKKVISEKKEDSIFNELLEFILKEKNIDKNQLLKDVDALVNEKNITKEVAVLLIGKNLDLVLAPYFEKVEKSIFT